jgi:hypothetical protein
VIHRLLDARRMSLRDGGAGESPEMYPEARCFHQAAVDLKM